MAEYILKQAVLDALRSEGITRNMRTYKRIHDIQAADVKPVQHGRWDGGTCTHCKLPWNYNMVQDADDWGYMDPMPDFCPNCGAKMDGEAGEDGRM